MYALDLAKVRCLNRSRTLTVLFEVDPSTKVLIIADPDAELYTYLSATKALPKRPSYRPKFKISAPPPIFWTSNETKDVKFSSCIRFVHCFSLQTRLVNTLNTSSTKGAAI